MWMRKTNFVTRTVSCAGHITCAWSALHDCGGCCDSAWSHLLEWKVLHVLLNGSSQGELPCLRSHPFFGDLDSRAKGCLNFGQL